MLKNYGMGTKVVCAKAHVLCNYLPGSGMATAIVIVYKIDLFDKYKDYLLDLFT